MNKRAQHLIRNIDTDTFSKHLQVISGKISPDKRRP